MAGEHPRDATPPPGPEERKGDRLGPEPGPSAPAPATPAAPLPASSAGEESSPGAGLLAGEARRALARRVDEAPPESPPSRASSGGLLWRVLLFIVLPWAAVLALAAFWQHQRNAERFVLTVEPVGPPPENRPGNWLWVRRGSGMFGTEPFTGRPQFDPVPLPAGTVLVRTEMQYETDLSAELLSLFRGLTEKMLDLPANAGTESARVYAARARLMTPLPRDTELAIKRMESEIALRDARRLVDGVGPTLAAARKSLLLARASGRFDEISELTNAIGALERARTEPIDATTGAMGPGAGTKAATGPSVSAGTGAPAAAGTGAGAGTGTGAGTGSGSTVRPGSSAPGAAPEYPDPFSWDGEDAGVSTPAESVPATEPVTCPPCVCRCETTPASPPASAAPTTAQPAPATTASAAPPKGRLL